ncbi:amino acid/amide ABC transporter ATP-binding protein 2 (HAAT family) [Breoghania corrubedonensis]|uniref:Amino acid/amide ABC transporter ATP-binding protein 2 (HAAT family) n=1 Tax=Breoghania corrubedonensis TaxID=665038 RepID=A0A2T5VFU5_9HYPH|nr:ABC transporter ATP-binding protein [Breoghania corrubedonensis]PTW62625.1 amino acid/amide ABC transporter ATP-binding protein 2 (HAAT family) [Breoghania corrubedonensis]
MSAQQDQRRGGAPILEAPILEARGLTTGYGGALVLEDLDITLHEGEVLCLIGHNGAGKSTLMKTLFGLHPAEAGEIRLRGEPVTGADPKSLSKAGIAMVPEGRGIFPSLTVNEIFEMGMWAVGVPEDERAERRDWVFSILPVIAEFRHRRAGTLSGGQAQMVSIGRALLGRPRILLLDEPSIGLAPKLFQDLLAPIRELQQREGLSILLVEQNVREALKISDRVEVMKSGRMIWKGLPEDLADNSKLMALY